MLSCALLFTSAACGSGSKNAAGTSGQAQELQQLQEVQDAADLMAADPTPTSTFEKRKFAKTRFVADAALAAGAAYQWIIKPYKKGKFKKDAKGRKLALVKAGLAGAFTYNRLKAATKNAKGDPLLSKALAPLTAGIDSLKGLGTKLRKGDASSSDVGSFNDIINKVKDAGSSAGAPVKDKVPSLSQLNKG
ncbi:hypothetical protein [Streptomyces paludis]|uniref:Uncharacterized protein n=1 Tax=Streptomyces paludis TaxID=2282738 RepID=A0A345I0G5_9ACTN|nr:hypothetical protein [Streptomyces paludis]AXG82439.1 hypothetical protein DVK44_07625 [Streptomyces paludis]